MTSQAEGGLETWDGVWGRCYPFPSSPATPFQGEGGTPGSPSLSEAPAPWRSSTPSPLIPTTNPCRSGLLHMLVPSLSIGSLVLIRFCLHSWTRASSALVTPERFVTAGATSRAGAQHLRQQLAKPHRQGGGGSAGSCQPQGSRTHPQPLSFKSPHEASNLPSQGSFPPQRWEHTG